MSLRTLLRNSARLGLLLAIVCALFLSSRGWYPPSFYPEHLWRRLHSLAVRTIRAGRTSLVYSRFRLELAALFGHTGAGLPSFHTDRTGLPCELIPKLLPV